MKAVINEETDKTPPPPPPTTDKLMDGIKFRRKKKTLNFWWWWPIFWGGGSNGFVTFLESPLFVLDCLSYFQRENVCAATLVAQMAPVVVGRPAHAQRKRVTVRAARSNVAAQVSSMCRDIIRSYKNQRFD